MKRNNHHSASGIPRFVQFLHEIADDGNWEYMDGTNMTADAQEFLASLSGLYNLPLCRRDDEGAKWQTVVVWAGVTDGRFKAWSSSCGKARIEQYKVSDDIHVYLGSKSLVAEVVEHECRTLSKDELKLPSVNHVIEHLLPLSSFFDIDDELEQQLTQEYKGEENIEVIVERVIEAWIEGDAWVLKW